jgi:hypothetical protein
MRVFFTGPLRRILKEDSKLFRQVHLFSFHPKQCPMKKVVVAVSADGYSYCP